MAAANSTVAMANPGYGKRNVPDQLPRTPHDFGHLPRREASIAAFVDRLPEGAAMDAKTLAKVLPDYGQAAVRTALNNLVAAGHLRRTRVHEIGEHGARWVTRTYFSRTARDADWWARFELGDQPVSTPAPGPAAAKPVSSPAYQALASLGRTDPRLTLSAADCKALESLAAQWLERDASPKRLLATLAAGLPPQVHSPAGFVRRRLEGKMPPESPPLREPEIVIGRLFECYDCDRPGSAAAMPRGFCKQCEEKKSLPDTFRPEPPPLDKNVLRHADKVRKAAGLPLKHGELSAGAAG